MSVKVTQMKFPAQEKKKSKNNFRLADARCCMTAGWEGPGRKLS